MAKGCHLQMCLSNLMCLAIPFVELWTFSMLKSGSTQTRHWENMSLRTDVMKLCGLSMKHAEQCTAVWRMQSVEFPNSVGGIFPGPATPQKVYQGIEWYSQLAGLQWLTVLSMLIRGITTGEWHILLSCYIILFWLRVKFDKFPSCEYTRELSQGDAASCATQEATNLDGTAFFGPCDLQALSQLSRVLFVYMHAWTNILAREGLWLANPSAISAITILDSKGMHGFKLVYVTMPTAKICPRHTQSNVGVAIAKAP